MANVTFELEQIEYAMEDSLGFCIACGEESDGAVEPDACNYKCSACGERQVFGAEEIVIMGLVT